MSELTVGAFTFQVDMGQKATLELASEGKLGDSTLERLLIRVRGDLPRPVRHEILLHEVMHMAWAQTGLAGDMPDEVEERVIRSLSPILSVFARFPTGL